MEEATYHIERWVFSKWIRLRKPIYNGLKTVKEAEQWKLHASRVFKEPTHNFSIFVTMTEKEV